MFELSLLAGVIGTQSPAMRGALLALSPALQRNLFLILPLVGSMLLVYGIYQVVSELRHGDRKRLTERLQGSTRTARVKAQASILKRDVTAAEAQSFVAATFGRLGFIPRIQAMLDQADVPWSAPHLIMNLSGIAVLVGAVLIVTGYGPIAALGCGVAIFVAPLMWFSFKRRRRMKKLTYQLPDVFEMMSQALRAGHSLASAIHLVHEQMPEPISAEFGRVFHEQNLGIKIEDALLAMADRVDSLDVRFFVTAVLIQRQTGGDLAEVLDKIGTTIRQRIELFGLVQGLTAEGRLSGWVLFALPIIVFVACLYLNPDYAGTLLNEPKGRMLLMIAGGMQLMGIAMIRWIVNIKV
ncbi:MAG TPA: type II secretion system F family protein [Phycisphaerae bacterium]|jgi:tight adherence protein B